MKNISNYSDKRDELDNLINPVLDDLLKDFSIEKPSKKLQEWYMLDWNDFLKEILKSGVNLTYPLKVSWENYFYVQKEKVEKLTTPVP